MSTENQTLIDRLFTAGAHFGFSKSRRHPSVVPYIFGAKQGTDIFDLEKTAELLEEAKATLKEAGAAGKNVLFVGTKEEASKLVGDTAVATDMPYVTNRWIGGMLTNFTEIKKRIARLEELITQGETGELERKYTKKERVVIKRELEKLQFNFGGVRTLKQTPHMMVVVDPRHDKIAVTEANELGIPVVGVMSSDNDLTKVTTPVVVNDALQSSVKLALGELSAAYLEGRETYTPPPVEDKRRNNHHRRSQ